MAEYQVASATFMVEPAFEYIPDCAAPNDPPQAHECGIRKVLYLVGDVRQMPDVVFVNGARYEQRHA